MRDRKVQQQSEQPATELLSQSRCIQSTTFQQRRAGPSQTGYQHTVSAPPNRVTGSPLIDLATISATEQKVFLSKTVQTCQGLTDCRQRRWRVRVLAPHSACGNNFSTFPTRNDQCGQLSVTPFSPELVSCVHKATDRRQRILQQKSGTMNVKLMEMSEGSTVAILSWKLDKKGNNYHVNRLEFRSPDVWKLWLVIWCVF